MTKETFKFSDKLILNLLKELIDLNPYRESLSIHDINIAIRNTVHKKGVNILGIAANDIKYSKGQLYEKKISKYLFWLFDLEDKLKNIDQELASSFLDSGKKYLYSRLIPSDISKWALFTSKHTTILKSSKVFSKKIQKFINDNFYDKITVQVGKKVICFENEVDCNFFMLIHGQDAQYEIINMFKYIEPIDTIIEKSHKAWKESTNVRSK